MSQGNRYCAVNIAGREAIVRAEGDHPSVNTCGVTCNAVRWVPSRMVTESPPEETTVNDQGMVTIPAALRRRLDIEPGDKLRWNVTENGELTVEVVKQGYGAFDDDVNARWAVTASKRTTSPAARETPRSRRIAECRSPSSIRTSSSTTRTRAPAAATNRQRTSSTRSTEVTFRLLGSRTTCCWSP